MKRRARRMVYAFTMPTDMSSVPVVNLPPWKAGRLTWAMYERHFNEPGKQVLFYGEQQELSVHAAMALYRRKYHWPLTCRSYRGGVYVCHVPGTLW